MTRCLLGAACAASALPKALRGLAQFGQGPQWLCGCRFQPFAGIFAFVAALVEAGSASTDPWASWRPTMLRPVQEGSESDSLFEWVQIERESDQGEEPTVVQEESESTRFDVHTARGRASRAERDKAHVLHVRVRNRRGRNFQVVCETGTWRTTLTMRLTLKA